MQTDEALVVHDAAFRRARGYSADLSEQDAEDVAQEAVIRFSRQESGSIANPAAWANTVAGNLCATLLKRIARGVPLPEDDEAPAVALEEFVTRGQPTSYGAIVRQQAGAVLALLNDRERELIQLVAEGTPQAEIAEIMGYGSADSVKTTLNRLRRKVLAAAELGGPSADWQDHPRPY